MMLVQFRSYLDQENRLLSWVSLGFSKYSSKISYDDKWLVRRLRFYPWLCRGVKIKQAHFRGWACSSPGKVWEKGHV